MSKLFALAAIALVAAFFAFAGDSHGAGAACTARVFNTRLVKDACARGGQPAAKDAMKLFTKSHMRRQPGLTCNSCHTRLAPTYPLKADGLAFFRRLGGT